MVYKANLTTAELAYDCYVQFQRELWEEELDRVLLNELFPKSLEEMQP